MYNTPIDDKITVLITDDHILIRQAWGFVLNKDVRFRVVGQSSNGEDAIEQVKKHSPEIIIMDIDMPGINGVETTREVLKIAPATKILAASLHKNPEYVRKMMAAGAKGYITKSSTLEEMFTALLELKSGKKYICKEIKSLLTEQLLQEDDYGKKQTELSKREMEIVEYIRKGLSSKDMAVNLQISEKTVQGHRHNILKKLNLKNAPALVNYFNENPVMLGK